MDFVQLEGLAAQEIDPDGIKWPANSIVLYAIEEGKVVGRIGYLYLPHIEATWIAEDKRGGTLAARLVKKMEEIVQESGSPAIFAYSYDNQPEVGGYLARQGYTRLPLSVHMKTFKESK